MSKHLKTVFGSILTLISALYLGFTFWDVCLDNFIPESLAVPGALVSAGGFVFLLRWLGQEVTPVSKSSAQTTPPCRKRCLLPPLHFKQANLPGWLSSSRNRVFIGREKGRKSPALSPDAVRN
jgi:hypothetical protein